MRLKEKEEKLMIAKFIHKPQLSIIQLIVLCTNNNYLVNIKSYYQRGDICKLIQRISNNFSYKDIGLFLNFSNGQICMKFSIGYRFFNSSSDLMKFLIDINTFITFQLNIIVNSL